MEVTDFRSLRRELVNQNMLNTSYFAEQVTYRPELGGERTITVKISQQGETEYSDAGDEAELEIIRVFAFRDAILGVSDPRLGDQIQRAVTLEADARPYTFHEEARGDSTDHHIVMLFARGRQTGKSPTQ